MIMSKKFSITGTGPTSIQHMHESDLVIMKKNKNIKTLHIAKNRYGRIGEAPYSVAIESTLYNKKLDEAIDILAEVIARKKFGGFTKVFEEGMKIEIINAVKKIVYR